MRIPLETRLPCQDVIVTGLLAVSTCEKFVGERFMWVKSIDHDRSKLLSETHGKWKMGECLHSLNEGLALGSRCCDLSITVCPYLACKPNGKT